MGWNDKRDTEGESGAFKYRLNIGPNPRYDYTSYNEGKTLQLVLDGERIQENGKVEDEANLWIALPDGWIPIEGGRAARHKDDDEKRFSKKSKIRIFIDSALAIPELAAIMQERGEDSRDASMFANLDLEIEEVDGAEWTDRVTKEKRSGGRERRVVAFHGDRGGAGGASGASSGSGSASAASNGVSNEVLLDLRTMAREYDSEGKDELDFLGDASKRHGLKLDDPKLADAWAKRA